jgi:ABC-type molybdate transport system substrate-binding protein
VLHNYYSCPFRLSLVVAARADDSNVRRLLKEGEIRQLANDYFRRVAVIAPENNYEGRLAKQILERYRLWKKLQPRLIMARDREQLINYLETGEAVAAIVLESTLNGHDSLRGFLRLDNKLQEYLQICGAVTAYSKKKEMAQAFMDLFDSRLCDIYKTRGIYQN